jgi:hypothetical protein
MSVMVLKLEYWLYYTWLRNQGIDTLPTEKFNELHFVFESKTDYFVTIIARLIVLADFIVFYSVRGTYK